VLGDSLDRGRASCTKAQLPRAMAAGGAELRSLGQRVFAFDIKTDGSIIGALAFIGSPSF
jgi:hypothetical protein